MPLRNRVEVTPGFCILWALLLLTMPLRILLAAFVAACVHELCHLLAVRLLGGQILGLTVGAGGMVMEVTPLSPGKEAAGAIAGPLGSLLLVMLGRWLPWLSLCAFIQGCFNLLPLYPLDGGRVLVCLLQMACPRRWKQIQNMAEYLMLGLLLIPVVRMQMGAVPIIIWAMLALRKIPCKEAQFGVQ